jgi:hypothetical protein
MATNQARGCLLFGVFLLGVVASLLPSPPVNTVENRDNVGEPVILVSELFAWDTPKRAEFWSHPTETRISRENFDRIESGMTQADVERIFGRPPGDYFCTYGDQNALAYYIPAMPVVVYNKPIRSETWRGDDGVVTVTFDAGRKVFKKVSGWAR